MNEKEIAIMEGLRNRASDEYFKVRARILDTGHNRKIFEAGYERGYQTSTERK
jgi:hypothetical protein